jgi:HSP20 family protein
VYADFSAPGRIVEFTAWNARTWAAAQALPDYGASRGSEEKAMATAIAKREPRHVRSWDPFQSLRDEVETLWSHVMGDRGNGRLSSAPVPPLDMKETPETVEVRIDVPGFKPEEINVQINNNLLTISGERVEETKKETATYHRSERRIGEFSRTVTLPAPVDQEKVDAQCRDGVLTVIMQKAPEAKSRQIKIKS